MSIAIPPSHGLFEAEVDHRATETGILGVDAASSATHSFDLRVQSPSRLLRYTAQPINGNGGAGEFHVVYKVTKPYGTWRAIPGTIAEALSVAELTSVALGGEGYAARDGIRVGSILRISGIVAADTPDSVVKMVVRVTVVTLTAGSADQIDFEHIWGSISRACDTGATLEVYDRTVVPTSALSEDIWLDLNTTVGEADDGSETDLILASEGIAATKGIVAGSIIRVDGVLAAVAVSEIMMVTAITLTGGQPDRITVIRGFWGTAAVAKDTAATLFMLNGMVGASKSLSGVTDNTYYEPTTLDDDFTDFGGHDYIRSIAIGAAELRVRYMLAPFKGTRN